MTAGNFYGFPTTTKPVFVLPDGSNVESIQLVIPGRPVGIWIHAEHAALGVKMSDELAKSAGQMNPVSAVDTGVKS